MASKVTVDLSGAERQIRDFKRQAMIALNAKIKDEIIENISRGVSPVRGHGRFEKYSAIYLEAIRNNNYFAKGKRFNSVGKRRTPRNLKLTGALHESIFSRIEGNAVIVGFKNKLADIHNRLGAGSSKAIRRMLPTNKGELFNRSITTTLREVLRKTANRIFR